MAHMTKARREQEHADAIEYLRDAFANCATTYRREWRDEVTEQPKLYFVIRRVSASGMSRVFHTFYVGRESGELVSIDHLIVALGIGTRVDDGYRVSGCGMDMRFHVADSIAHALGDPRWTNGNAFDIRSV